MRPNWLAANLLILASLTLLSGCGEKQESNPYPVASGFTEARISEICAFYGVSGTLCEEKVLEVFQQALVDYYQAPQSRTNAFKICSLDPWVCEDLYRLEDWFKNYR